MVTPVEVERFRELIKGIDDPYERLNMKLDFMIGMLSESYPEKLREVGTNNSQQQTLKEANSTKDPPLFEEISDKCNKVESGADSTKELSGVIKEEIITDKVFEEGTEQVLATKKNSSEVMYHEDLALYDAHQLFDENPKRALEDVKLHIVDVEPKPPDPTIQDEDKLFDKIPKQMFVQKVLDPEVLSLEGTKIRKVLQVFNEMTEPKVLQLIESNPTVIREEFPRITLLVEGSDTFQIKWRYNVSLVYASINFIHDSGGFALGLITCLGLNFKSNRQISLFSGIDYFHYKMSAEVLELLVCYGKWGVKIYSFVPNSLLGDIYVIVEILGNAHQLSDRSLEGNKKVKVLICNILINVGRRLGGMKMTVGNVSKQGTEQLYKVQVRKLRANQMELLHDTRLEGVQREQIENFEKLPVEVSAIFYCEVAKVIDKTSGQLNGDYISVESVFSEHARDLIGRKSYKVVVANHYITTSMSIPVAVYFDTTSIKVLNDLSSGLTNSKHQAQALYVWVSVCRGVARAIIKYPVCLSEITVENVNCCKAIIDEFFSNECATGWLSLLVETSSIGFFASDGRGSALCITDQIRFKLYRVLFDVVGEYDVGQSNEFKDQKLISTTMSENEKKKMKKLKKKLENFYELRKEVLSDRLKKIITSNCVVESVCCFVIGELDMCPSHGKVLYIITLPMNDQDFLRFWESAEDAFLDHLDTSTELVLSLMREVNDALVLLNLEETGSELMPICSGSERIHAAIFMDYIVEDVRDKWIDFLEEKETYGVQIKMETITSGTGYDVVVNNVSSYLNKVRYNLNLIVVVPVHEFRYISTIKKFTSLDWYKAPILVIVLHHFNELKKFLDKAFDLSLQEVYKISGIRTMSMKQVKTGTLKNEIVVTLSFLGQEVEEPNPRVNLKLCSTDPALVGESFVVPACVDQLRWREFKPKLMDVEQCKYSETLTFALKNFLIGGSFSNGTREFSLSYARKVMKNSRLTTFQMLGIFGWLVRLFSYNILWSNVIDSI